MEVFSLLYQITLNDNFSDTCSLRALTLELVLCLCHFVTLASLWHLIDASSAQRVQISPGFGGGGGRKHILNILRRWQYKLQLKGMEPSCL